MRHYIHLIIISLALLGASISPAIAADSMVINGDGSVDVLTPMDATSGLGVQGGFSLSAGPAVTEVSDDTNLVDASSTALPTEAAVKAYVDAQVAGGSSGGFTTGDIKQTMATTEPAGWLFLNGQAVSRTGDTADLFALFGTSYGAGDGSTTFNLPDARGRVLAAVDDLGGSPAGVVLVSAADSVGGTHGAEVHTLTESEMPSHGHGMSSAGAHTHKAVTSGFGGSTHGKFSVSSVRNVSYSSYPVTNSAGAHTHTISSTGGDQPHNNMQPTMFVNTLIKK